MFATFCVFEDTVTASLSGRRAPALGVRAGGPIGAWPVYGSLNVPETFFVADSNSASKSPDVDVIRAGICLAESAFAEALHRLP